LSGGVVRFAKKAEGSFLRTDSQGRYLKAAGGGWRQAGYALKGGEEGERGMCYLKEEGVKYRARNNDKGTPLSKNWKV